MSMFNLTLYYSVFCYSSISISISSLESFILLALAPAVISSSEPVCTANVVTSVFVAYIGAPVKIPYN